MKHGLVVATAICVILVTLIGCNNGTGPGGCHLLDGVIRVQMSDGVRADSATAILRSAGAPYDTTSVHDCFLVFFQVHGVDVMDATRALQQMTQAGVVGSWSDSLIFAALCDLDSTEAIRLGSLIPGLRFDHVKWYAIDTQVQVPQGDEDQWIATFRWMRGVAAAERVTWCPI